MTNKHFKENSNLISLPISESSDVILARQMGRKVAQELGFSSIDQTKLATAISELARNIIQQHAVNGYCRIFESSDEKLVRIVAIIEDFGPGISDLKKAMEYGFSTSGGLGAGLPGTQRIVHEFSIESSPAGTKVTIGMVRPR